jgi:hypothetical protein
MCEMGPPALKRLRITDDRHEYDHASAGPLPIWATNGSGELHELPACSSHHDVASLAEESAAPAAQGSQNAFPQHSTFISHHLPHYHPQQQMYEPTFPQGSFPVKTREGGDGERRQPPGLARGGVATPHATEDYHPMNSLLGDLHMMRRQQRRGRNSEESYCQSHEHNEQHQDMMPESYSHYSSGHQSGFPTQQLQHQEQQVQHQHQHQPNRQQRPSKKKVISLRTDSNLY